MRPIQITLLAALLAAGCNGKSSDQIQSEQQEQILKEGTSEIGMPGIRYFAERRAVKRIMEERDNAKLATFTYVFSPFLGLLKVCDSVGYPLPYSTQYTSPQKVITNAHGGFVVSQADPNGLYSPGSSRASWVLCKVPGKDETAVVYSEPDLMGFPYEVPGARPLGTFVPPISAR